MHAITIHEVAGVDGGVLQSRLVWAAGSLSLAVGSEVFPLPDGALDAVMQRYGKPLAAEEHEMTIEERLDLDEGRRLVRFRFMRRYDVIARDYLVLYAPDHEPLCEMATSVAGALDHLARRFSAG